MDWTNGKAGCTEKSSGLTVVVVDTCVTAAGAGTNVKPGSTRKSSIVAGIVDAGVTASMDGTLVKLGSTGKFSNLVVVVVDGVVLVVVVVIIAVLVVVLVLVIVGVGDGGVGFFVVVFLIKPTSDGSTTLKGAWQAQLWHPLCLV